MISIKQVKPPITPDVTNLPIYLSIIGGTNDQVTVNRPSGSDVWHIFFTVNGQGECKTPEKKHVLSYDNILIIKSSECHNYYPVTMPWETRWILFSGKEIDSLMNTLGINETTVVKIYEREFIHKNFYLLYDICKNAYDPTTVSGILYMIICKIAQWHKKQTELLPCDCIERASIYINSHYSEIISLKDIAKYARVSQQYLCRMFKKHLNMRPFEYINKVRIEKAQDLLINSHFEINKIAEMCSFESHSYFSKKFKKYTGISPSQFVKYYKE